MSLWALAPSPLMLGLDLPDNDAFTEALLENEEVRNIFTALGVGIGEGQDLMKLRYGKVILMADADIDGPAEEDVPGQGDHLHFGVVPRQQVAAAVLRAVFYYDSNEVAKSLPPQGAQAGRQEVGAVPVRDNDGNQRGRDGQW